jgi:hypothetical protein
MATWTFPGVGRAVSVLAIGNWHTDVVNNAASGDDVGRASPLRGYHQAERIASSLGLPGHTRRSWHAGSKRGAGLSQKPRAHEGIKQGAVIAMVPPLIVLALGVARAWAARGFR